MMYKRLAILGCCALSGFAFGRWLSPSAGARSVEGRTADSQVVAPVAPVELPPPERAGRVPFAEVYRSLRSSSPAERTAYLHSIQQLPDGPDRRAALTAFFQCVASIRPEEAEDLVRQVGKDDIQRVVLAVLAATSTPSTPGLVKMLLDLPADVDPEWRERMLNGQMFFLAAVDPTAAAQFADQYRNIYPNLAAHGIVQFLAASDPAAADRWLKEHPDLRKQPEVMNDYLTGLYQGDPATARRYFAEHATEEGISPGGEKIARLTFFSSADEAFDFISHLSAKEARRVALDGILDINTELFVTSETSRSALCAGLAQWVTKFSPDDWPTTMPEFLDRWRELDPDGSISWMASLPSPTRSAITVEFMRYLPSDQFRQVLATTAGDFHHDILAAVGERLLASDDPRAFIEALKLSPEDAAQLAALVH